MLWRKKDISKGVYGVNVGAGTHAGRVREKNEDAYYAIPPSCRGRRHGRIRCR